MARRHYVAGTHPVFRFMAFGIPGCSTRFQSTPIAIMHHDPKTKNGAWKEFCQSTAGCRIDPSGGNSRLDFDRIPIHPVELVALRYISKRSAEVILRIKVYRI